MIYDSVVAPDVITDFDHVWYAATAVLHGRDPYALIGPGREFEWTWPLYYPLMAPLSILPLGLLPLSVARVLFVSLPSGVLAYVFTRDGFGRLAFFLTGSFMANVKAAQWGPLIACVVLVPQLGFFGAAKPNFGLAAIGGARSGRDLAVMAGGMVLVTVLAFLVQPGWFGTWYGLISTGPYFHSYALQLAGLLLFLALLRWRRWEARLLLALALAPQTPSLSSPLLLLLIPKSLRGLLVMGLLSFAPVLFPGVHAPDYLERIDRAGQATLLFVFLPALLLVLREPNVGPMPAAIERLVARLPAWLRGTSGPAADPIALTR